MPEMTDMDLVRDFSRDRSEAAFAELVRRHLNLVYSAALRYTGNNGDAQDIAQAVFVLLAQKAAEIHDRTVLTGWLYETTRFTALRWLRAKGRRQAREQEAYMQSLNADSADVWQQISPHLESAMSQLAESDRTLLALRFYENKTGQEAANLLGIREDAAHKRTSRALEKLRKYFSKHGITATTAAIAAAVSGNAVQSAPAGLAAAITTAALSGTVVTTAAIVAATKAITMTTLQKTAVAAALVITTSVGVFEAHENSTLRKNNRELQQSQAPLQAQLEQLQREHDKLTNQLATLISAPGRSTSNSLELLQLRGMAGVARRATEEAENLRRQLAQQAAQSGTNLLSGVMMDSMKQAMEMQVQGHLARLDTSLHFTPEQMLAASNILMRQADLVTAGMQQTFTGKFDKDELFRAGKAAGDPDTQIKALLTPEQQADFPAYKHAEATYNASFQANTELVQLKTILNLTSDQFDPVYTALYSVNFDQLTGNAKPPASLGNAGDVMQWTLNQKVTALEPLLTPVQLELYRQQQASQAKLIKDITSKMLGPGDAK